MRASRRGEGRGDRPADEDRGRGAAGADSAIEGGVPRSRFSSPLRPIGATHSAVFMNATTPTPHAHIAAAVDVTIGMPSRSPPPCSVTSSQSRPTGMPIEKNRSPGRRSVEWRADASWPSVRGGEWGALGRGGLETSLRRSSTSGGAASPPAAATPATEARLPAEGDRRDDRAGDPPGRDAREVAEVPDRRVVVRVEELLQRHDERLQRQHPREVLDPLRAAFRRS